MSYDTLDRFFLLPELQLTKAYYRGTGAIGFDVHKVSAFEICPSCATPSSSVYDRRIVTVKDDLIRGKSVTLRISKRRFQCRAASCRKVFTEPVPGIGKRARTTWRFKKSIAWACQHMINLKDVAKQYRCSSRLVYTAFYNQMELWTKQRVYALPEKIGLDEHSIRKPKYQATEFATIVVDHKKKAVYDLIDGKSKSDLNLAFAKFTGRDRVKVVTMDCSEPYRSFAKEQFPNAMIVADRFHVERIFTRKVNKYRKKLTGDERKNPINKLLLRPSYKLKFFERCAVVKWLNHQPQLREIWEVKEALSRFYRTKGLRRAKKALGKLLDRMGASKNRAVLGLRKTLLRWRQEVLNFHVERLSNGRVEGFNRVGKLIQRMAYGYRNFQHYRLRLLNTCFFRS